MARIEIESIPCQGLGVEVAVPPRCPSCWRRGADLRTELLLQVPILVVVAVVVVSVLSSLIASLRELLQRLLLRPSVLPATVRL